MRHPAEPGCREAPGSFLRPRTGRVRPGRGGTRRPCQTAGRPHAPGRVIYQRFSPAPALAAAVECYWYLRRAAPAPGAAIERIVPDGCCELIFNFGEPIRAPAGAGRWETQPTAMLVGQISRCLEIAPDGAIEMLGVRFHPAGAAAFWPLALHELTDGHAALDALDRPWRELEVRLHDVRTTAARIALLERALLARRAAAHGPGNGGRLTAAVARLRGSGGTARIADLAAELNVSARQLERDFTRGIGLPPKQLARIFRCREVLRAVQRGDRRWADVAVACGYFDQAHLVNEFRLLTGATPDAYLRAATALGTAFAG